MNPRPSSLLAGIAAALVLPVANADQPSHNVPGERGYVFHDARGDSARSTRDLQQACSGWRLVGGEAVWIYERRANCVDGQRPSQTGQIPALREDAIARNMQVQNSIYHGA